MDPELSAKLSIEVVRLLMIVFPTAVIAQSVLPPVNRVREMRRRISHALTYYANVYPVGKFLKAEENLKPLNDASRKLRNLAAELRAARDNVMLYPVLSFLGLIPKWNDTAIAAYNLIGWSNYMF